MNDKEWILRLKANDADALGEVIDQYSGYVLAVIRKTLPEFCTREDREDLTAEVFTTLWQHRERLIENRVLRYWLAVVARNHALLYLRKHRLSEPLEEDFLQLQDPEPGPTMKAETLEQINMVRVAIGTLHEEDRDLFIRHYYWQHSISRISTDTGMNESTIKSRLLRGRKRLKAILIKKGCFQ